MALGSTAGNVFGLVLSEGAKIIGAGLALGLAGTALLAQAIGSLLYGVQPMDPLVIASVAGALVVIAFVAVLIPARRASRVSPLTALT
jgi:ABC-type antimicrobial peptide transport system permease subunit